MPTLSTSGHVLQQAAEQSKYHYEAIMPSIYKSAPAQGQQNTAYLALVVLQGDPCQVDGGLHCPSMWVVVSLKLLQQTLQCLIHLQPWIASAMRTTASIHSLLSHASHKS